MQNLTNFENFHFSGRKTIFATFGVLVRTHPSEAKTAFLGRIDPAIWFNTLENLIAEIWRTSKKITFLVEKSYFATYTILVKTHPNDPKTAFLGGMDPAIRFSTIENLYGENLANFENFHFFGRK